MTSIEWLEEKAKSMVINGGDLGEDYPALMVHIQQAKEMHKEEIEDAFQDGKWDWSEHITNGTESKDLEQYYNEKYKTD